ncbi:MAG: serine/threonine protein kinase [Planctomycetes bacterium]|nr:serine/threonine protein kinase [Planctomycetota bacterium]
MNKEDKDKENEGIDSDFFSDNSVVNSLKSLYNQSVSSLDADEVHPLYKELKSISERYQIEEELGRGAMKIVSRAHDFRLEKDVAFAVMKEEFGADSFDAFLREARLTARLEHPSIIKVIDAGIKNDRPYFAMELKSSTTLKDIILSLLEKDPLSEKRYSLDKCLEIFLKVCDAVAYAHSRGVIHLDLKPENVQVGSYGEVIVCDWGLGKVISEDKNEKLGILGLDPKVFNDLTLIGLINGTPGYMAPEQIEESENIGYHTDIYALGALLYSILTHERSYEGSTQDILDQTCEGDLTPPSERSHTKSYERLDAVVLKAMARKPKNRYHDVLHLRDEVENFLSGFATTAENAGIIRLASLMYHRNRLLFNLIGMGLVLFIFLLTLFMIRIKQSEQLAVAEKFKAEQQRNIAEKQMRIAREQRHAAITHRREANEAMDLYYIQKTLTLNKGIDDSLRNLSKWIRLIARDLNTSKPDINSFLRIERDIDQHLFNKSIPKEARLNLINRKGVLSFIMLDFNAARECIGEGWNAPSSIAEACAPFFFFNYHGDGYSLNESETSRYPEALKICDLIRHLLECPHDPRIPLSYRILSEDLHTELMLQLSTLICTYDSLARANRVDHSLIVHSLLNLHNPGWCSQLFAYNPKKERLQLGGKGLKVLQQSFSSPHSIQLLASLKLRQLVLKSTNHDLSQQLTKLPLESLDIQNAYVINLKHVAKIPGLNRLIMRHDQFSSKELASLPASIQTIFTAPSH